MKQCCVCFEGTKSWVKCFGVCNIELCLSCFISILKINRVEQIEFCCPTCRHTSIKNEDKTFTKFLNNNKKCLKRMVYLLENHYEAEYKRLLENMWGTISIL